MGMKIFWAQIELKPGISDILIGSGHAIFFKFDIAWDLPEFLTSDGFPPVDRLEADERASPVCRPTKLTTCFARRIAASSLSP